MASVLETHVGVSTANKPYDCLAMIRESTQTFHRDKQNHQVAEGPALRMDLGQGRSKEVIAPEGVLRSALWSVAPPCQSPNTRWSLSSRSRSFGCKCNCANVSDNGAGGQTQDLVQDRQCMYRDA